MMTLKLILFSLYRVGLEEATSIAGFFKVNRLLKGVRCDLNQLSFKLIVSEKRFAEVQLSLIGGLAAIPDFRSLVNLILNVYIYFTVRINL
jgi:hypothetical protein